MSARSGRRDHGTAPPRASARGRAVPPRVRADPARQAAAAPTSSPMPNPVLTEAIDRLSDNQHLPPDEASRVLKEIIEGNASEAQAAAFLIALRTKGETADEIVGLASVLRDHAVKVDAGDGLVDTAGTGGGRPTFNVSTTAAFIAAGAGCRVAKHGNRSATSQCGSADVLEALGGRIEVGVDVVEACIREIGFGFMFAPLHHPAFKHIVPVRKELGRADDLQLPRAAHESGRGAPPGDRRLGPRKARDDGGGAGAAGGREGPGSVERRWPGRVLGLGRDPGGGAEGRPALHV